MDITKASWLKKFSAPHLKIAVLICVLAGLCAYNAHAQDSLYTNPYTALIYPDDLEATKVGLFFTNQDINLSQCETPELYFEIYRWRSTNYRYGGNSKSGIDCSHFAGMLYKKVYGKELSTSAGSIYKQCVQAKKSWHAAKEGDLVFFKIRKGQISHVGIYLQNNKFIHASTHSGVIISDMNEPYYKKHFYRVAKLKEAGSN